MAHVKMFSCDGIAVNNILYDSVLHCYISKRGCSQSVNQVKSSHAERTRTGPSGEEPEDPGGSDPGRSRRATSGFGLLPESDRERAATPAGGPADPAGPG